MVGHLLTSALDGLRDDLVGAGVISVAILALFAGAEVVGRVFAIGTEWTRKATHLGSGAIVLAFPWLLSHTATVVALAVAFAGVLVGGRVTGLLGSIHDVERRTGGAYYYPFAVLGIWVLSGGDPLLYCVPLAVMAVADTGAALVGQRAGQTTYRVMDGERSVEGSMAFFGLAFGIVLLGCALAGRPGWPAALLVTLVVATLTTSVEAVSIRGSDNLAIPYAAWLALERTERLGLDALGDWVFGMTLGLVLLFLTAGRARLDAAGGVVVFLVSTLSYALGGLAWFVPMAALYAGFLIARTPDATGLDRVFPTTAGSMIVVLLFAHTDRADLYLAYLCSLTASGAMAGHLIARVRGWPPAAVVPAAVVGPLAAARAVTGEVPLLLPLLTAAVGWGFHKALRRGPPVGRRVLISLAMGIGGWWIAWVASPPGARPW